MQQITRSGLTPSLAAAAAGGDEFANDGRTFFYASNGGAASRTVTIDVAKTVDGQAVTDRSVTVAAGAGTFIGPFPTSIYNDGDGHVNVTYSDSGADLTVGAFRV